MGNHRHEITLRWADVDSVNHINNVQYARYAMEAREALEREGLWQPRAITSSKIVFLREVLLSHEAMWVETDILGSGMVHHLGVKGSDVPHATVEIGWGHVPAIAPHDFGWQSDLQMRVGDLTDGYVSPGDMPELLQETRIAFMAQILRGMGPGDFVLASVEYSLVEPISFGPLETITWVDRIGTSSYDVKGQLMRGGEVLLEQVATLVRFDGQTRKSRPLSPSDLAQLELGAR